MQSCYLMYTFLQIVFKRPPSRKRHASNATFGDRLGETLLPQVFRLQHKAHSGSKEVKVQICAQSAQVVTVVAVVLRSSIGLQTGADLGLTPLKLLEYCDNYD